MRACVGNLGRFAESPAVAGWMSMAVVLGVVSITTPCLAHEPASAPNAPATDAASPVAPSVTDIKDAKAACVSHHDRAQAMRSQRKLVAARASFVACGAETCPEVLREDCARSLVELDTNIPSIVFSATSAGRDVDDARVLLDEVDVVSPLAGHAITVDPGPHIARFERAGEGAVETRFVAREGEKNRLVSARFGPLLPDPKPIKAETRHVPVVPIALASVGLVALGSAFVFRMNASSDADDLRTTCAPACGQGSRDALSEKLVLSNVSLGVGIGALALSAATWLLDPNR